ncbi:MAG: hypothetical protein ACLSEY_14710 [Enterocloster sp.]
MKDKEINNFIRETGKWVISGRKSRSKMYTRIPLEEALADRQRSYDKMKDMLTDEETMKEESSDIELEWTTDKQIVDLEK